MKLRTILEAKDEEYELWKNSVYWPKKYNTHDNNIDPAKEAFDNMLKDCVKEFFPKIIQREMHYRVWPGGNSIFEKGAFREMFEEAQYDGWIYESDLEGDLAGAIHKLGSGFTKLEEELEKSQTTVDAFNKIDIYDLPYEKFTKAVDKIKLPIIKISGNFEDPNSEPVKEIKFKIDESIKNTFFLVLDGEVSNIKIQSNSNLPESLLLAVFDTIRAKAGYFALFLGNMKLTIKQGKVDRLSKEDYEEEYKN